MTGCVSQQYLDADQATHDAIAPEYTKYIDADATLSDNQREIRRLNLESWQARIEAWRDE
jgi:hypothetical protein